MSDQEAQSAPNAPEAAQGDVTVSEGVEISSWEQMALSIQSVLGAFVPNGDKVTFLDAKGAAHESSVLLSARKQFLLAKLVQENYSLAQTFASANQKMSMFALVAAINTEHAFDALLDAFILVHPDECLPDTVAQGSVPKPSRDVAADRFPIQEMIKALLPFFAHPLSEMADLTLDAVEASRRPR